MATMDSASTQPAPRAASPQPRLLGRVSEPLSSWAKRNGHADNLQDACKAEEASEDSLPLTRQMSTMSAMMALPAFEENWAVSTSLVFPLMVFDKPVDLDAFRERLRQRLFIFQRFRSKAIRSPSAKGVIDSFFFEPLRIDDIDMSYHVATMNSIRTDDDMFEYMNQLWAGGMDMEKPLWRWLYLDNCTDGRYRLLGVFDHSVGDGFTMVKTLLSLLDDNVPELQAKKECRLALPAQRAAPQVSWATKLHARAWGLLAPFLAGLLVDSASCLRPAGQVLSTSRKVFAHSEPIDFAKVKEIKARFAGATVNDVMMALLTLSVKRYLDKHGHGSSQKVRLSAVFPINRREGGVHARLTEASFGNKILIGRWPFDFAFKDRIECVWRAKRTAAWLKHNPRPYVESWLQSMLMPRLSIPSLRRLTEKTMPSMPTAMLTNVPGPQQPVHFLDQQVADMRFHAVCNTFGLMYQLFSYNGKVSATINLDPSLGDASELAGLWKTEFDNLYADVMQSDKRQLAEPASARSFGAVHLLLSTVAIAVAVGVAKFVNTHK
eukprot:TRINITY_DN32153_c0_g1_i1.p1 TRINITY_DN32153_c0_g1~~TRINITY_DN32153_c0_g1_i1.p1  ORF type:complete len:549 (-),score=87.98 TRINITY_DN32153_c0_g1_i1:179-1825(-)